MLTSEIIGLCVVVFLVMFSILFGLSGGVLIVPIGVLVLRFSPREAVALSNSIVAMTSGIKYLIGLRKSNPRVSFKAIIDYNAVITMAPFLVMCSTFGGILSNILPDIVVMGLMLACLTFSSVCTLIQIRIQHQKDQVFKGSTISQFTISEKTSVYSEREPHKEIEDQKRIEGENFYFPKFVVILTVILLSLLLGLIRGGQGFHSILGIIKCSREDWATQAVYAFCLITLTAYTANLIFREQHHKKMIGWNLDPEEVHFTRKTFTLTLLWSSVTGMIATITGIGGGTLLNPFFWWLKFQPVTTAWTINVTTLLSKLAAALMIILSGEMMWDYVLVFGGLIAVAIFVAENLLLDLIKKTKSQAIIPSGLLLILLICMSFTGYQAYQDIAEKLRGGVPIWRLSKYC